MRAVVETGISEPAPGTATWKDLRDPALQDQFHEVLSTTPTVDTDEQIEAVAAELKASSASPAAGVEATVAWVHDRLTYKTGVTEVSTTATEVLQGGVGVCQDYTHLTLAILRTMGVPSWYVSGYLHPHPDPEIGEPVVGESHAWVAAWTGRVWPLDPTSMTNVDERHVRVATGRDYDDVMPFRGIYAGGGDGQELDVAVEVTRLV